MRHFVPFETNEGPKHFAVDHIQGIGARSVDDDIQPTLCVGGFWYALDCSMEDVFRVLSAHGCYFAEPGDDE
jgi:hypothetical protein